MDLRDSIPDDAHAPTISPTHKRIMHIVARKGAAYTSEIAPYTQQKEDSVGSKCHDLMEMGFLKKPVLGDDVRIFRRSPELKRRGLTGTDTVHGLSWWVLPNSIRVEDENGDDQFIRIILIDREGIPRTPIGRKLVPEWAIEKELVSDELVEMGADEASKKAYEDMERKLSMDQTLEEPLGGR